MLPQKTQGIVWDLWGSGFPHGVCYYDKARFLQPPRRHFCFEESLFLAAFVIPIIFLV